MAARGGERRLVFDVRGRRRHVVRVVYAILALLMMSSLFFVVGPFNVGSLFGRGGTTSAAKIWDEQAERIERRLARDPKNAAILLSLARTRFLAGNARVERDPVTTEIKGIPPESRAEYEKGLNAWDRYLKQTGGKASPVVAETTAGVYNSLAVYSSGGLAEVEGNLGKAAKAQAVAAARRSSLHSLSALAYYEYRSGNFAAGDKARAQVQRKASSKAEAKAVASQLAKYRKEGKEIQKQLQSFAKLERKKGKEALQNPLGGLGSSGTGLGP